MKTHLWTGPTRRSFLGSSAAFVSLTGFVPRLFADAAAQSALAGKSDKVLVVVELAGGNDGLNTLVPFENDRYYHFRKAIGIKKEEALRLSDHVGLHPSMAPFAELFKQGSLAVIQGAGYPEPDRSHFRSMEIWQTASIDKRPPTTGWLGRVLDTQPRPAGDAALPGLALTGSLPQAFQADSCVVPVVGELEQFTNAEGSPAEMQTRRKLSTTGEKSGASIDFVRQQAEAVFRTADKLKEAAAKYKSTVEYPGGGLAGQLRRAAQIIAGDLGTRILYVSQDGYDTHSNQPNQHGQLLGDLAASLAAFDKDLHALGVADKVAVMVFSEFGRRVDENASNGTDHGAASVMFVQGAGIQGGLVGEYPSLDKLGEGDLIYTTDFRSVYATLLDQWLACPSTKVLGQQFAMLPLVKKT
jgi:uncharacterized protein (DUF1501 family)